MRCPECQFDNREGAKFCKKCGAKLEHSCPQCDTPLTQDSLFCDECGYDLQPPKEVFDEISESESPTIQPITEKPSSEVAPGEGERKHVTVLFSDLSGYTGMSEKLDPEEVKEITSRIFSGISNIVANYDGFIEKYAGDAVMAIFGVPQVHEDDPVRAIKAAREIHQLVDSISPEIENRIGQSISMHTGINTGLVVTGEVDMQRGTHGIAGDTINLASRLSNLAKPGEILIDGDTCVQVEGQFECEYLETTSVKGKDDPVQVNKVLSFRDKPVTIHRLSGLRADLIGRKVEMAELSEAVENLREGRGRIFSISGFAGTGKSRLVEEFKATLDFERIQWIEGHAYAYSQNIPYFPLIDLLNRILHIVENDPPEKVKEKVESGIKSLVGKHEDVIPYIGGLYSLSYPQMEKVSPEFWKSRLQAAIMTILSSLANKSPTIFFLEDLHWADPSFVEILRRACLEIRQPAIVLCAYRPNFNLFSGPQLNSIGKYYHEIQLQDLSLSEAYDMLESLLKTDSIPLELKRWLQSKAEGNPFYLEELVNSLIESDSLIRENGSWKLARAFTESDIPSSLHGLISGRLDRLEKQTKRILQEASVIGRDFLYEILKRITELEYCIDGELNSLERLDLIRIRSLKPDLEYMFKHALTQEIVYNGMLKKQRREIHEQIARAIESIFKDRLTEFYETLAYHFARGKSVNKAIEYLVKAGEKSLLRFSVEEAHQYYKKAYGLLALQTNKTGKEKSLIIDMMNSWGNVYYYLGENDEFIKLFNSNKDLAETLGDKARLGMFYVWFGVAVCMAGQLKDAYEYLLKALKLGEESGDQKLIGYACTWLPWVCSDLGRFDEGIEFGNRAQKIAEFFPADQYLFYKSLGGLSEIFYFKGDTSKVAEGATRLIEYGEKTSNSRSKSMGYWMKGFEHFLRGDLTSAQKSCEKSSNAARDTIYPLFSKTLLNYIFLLRGQYSESEAISEYVIEFSEKRGLGYTSEVAYLTLCPILIMKGRMQEGLIKLKETQQKLVKNSRKIFSALAELVLGEIYSQIATGPKPSLAIMAKNIGFLAKNVPFATRKAEQHFKKAIELTKEFGMKFYIGLACLSLGQLLKANKRADEARQCISEAVDLFQECGAAGWLKQANEALDSLV